MEGRGGEGDDERERGDGSGEGGSRDVGGMIKDMSHDLSKVLFL